MEIQIYDKTIQFFSSTWWKQNRNKIWIYDSDSCWTCFEDKTMWISNYARYWVRKVTLEWSLTLSEIYWPSAEDFSQFMPRFKCASGQVDLNLTSFVWEKISMTESRSPRRRNGESQLCKQKNDKKVRRREFIARFQSSGEANTSGSYFATSRNGRPRPQQKIHSRKRAAKNYNRAKSSSPHACALFTPREDFIDSLRFPLWTCWALSEIRDYTSLRWRFLVFNCCVFIESIDCWFVVNNWILSRIELFP